jgi:hypothetical protein
MDQEGHPVALSNGNMSIDNDRQHKIRIVEKLGSIRNIAGLNGNSIEGPDRISLMTPPPFLSKKKSTTDGGIITGENQWLDDQELSKMTNAQLETLMDEYIISVVKQLVNIAMADDELKAEIDSLDSHGYNLLHYCSLYNLSSLITELLKKGAQINEKTDFGSCSLHLAAAAGHTSVVELLIENGADLVCLNADGESAYEIALMHGNETLASRIDQVSISDVCLDLC